jgi:hypothetical protein
MRVNVIGNGPNATMFKKGTPGAILVCNMPPVDLDKDDVYGSCMVDFKMMNALKEGLVDLDKYDWILGTRPRVWMEKNPTFYMKYAQNIKGFHTHIPTYAQLPGQKLSEAATNYSCGHMATDYACRIMRATEVHMYGFDSMFDMDINSHSDNFLKSDRTALNTHRLASTWRPVWVGFFREFSTTQFYIYHSHDGIKLPPLPNVTAVVEGEE